MRDWVKFFEPTQTVSATGSVEIVFQKIYETWCQFTALSGGESVIAASMRGTTEGQIFYRRLNAPNVQSKWRIEINNQVWQILSVMPIENDRSMMRAVIRYGVSEI